MSYRSGLRDIGSVMRGIRAIQKPYGQYGPKWFFGLGRRGFWCEFWTPTWHEGRGPYLTIGLGFMYFGRGY